MPDTKNATGMDNRRSTFNITSQVREFVFGIQDGMLTVLTLVTGLSSATAIGSTAALPIEANKAILVAGCIEAIGGMVSMGVGEYISSKAQADVYKAEIEKERQEMKDNPWEEREEVRILFEDEGLSTADASIVADKITTSEQSWLKTMVEKELHMSYDDAEGGGFVGPLVIGLAYIVGAVLPIAPYLFVHADVGIYISVALTVLGLFTVGAIKGRLADQNIIRSGLEIAIIGSVTAIFAYFVGQGIQALFGVKVN